MRAIQLARPCLAACFGLLWLLLGQAAHAMLPIQHWRLPSGAEVYWSQVPGLPIVDLQIDVDAGSRRDPADRAGLAAVAAGMLLKASGALPAAGRPALDENAVADAWADLGASFSASASADRLSLGLRSLSYPDLLPRVVALAAQQLAAPAFDPQLWAREQQRSIAALQEALRRPATLAARAFAPAVYGDHPYGQQVSEASLKAIEVEDLRAWYARSLLPCRMVISLVGDLDKAQASQLVESLLSHLKQPDSCPALPPVPEVAPLVAARELQMAQPSAQAHVLLGQPGFKRDDPDFFALTVGNYILGGGGLVSRLSTEVREKRGLSYSTYSYFSPGLHAGAFTVGLQTRPDQARAALALARQVVADFVAQGPTPQELRAAKDNLVGGFALRIDSNRKWLDNVANIAWNRLPLDYLAHWTEAVEQVTAEQVQAAFARKLQPQAMVSVLVGAQP